MSKEEPIVISDSEAGSSDVTVVTVEGSPVKGKYMKLGPPHDICLQHEDWRSFTPHGSSTPPDPIW